LSEWLVGKKAVANALGVSVSTVKRYLKRYPDLPVNRRGRTIYVAPETLKAWVENRNLKRCRTCGIALPA
jgi:transposase